MKNGKQLIETFQRMQTPKFVGLRNYKTQTNEVCDYKINVNISVTNAKATDLELLQNADIQAIAAEIMTSKGIAAEITQLAHNELLVSAIKNLSENIEDRSEQSKAQTEAYLPLCQGIRLHKDSGKVHIFGLIDSKTVLCEGDPKKPVNSSPKTIAKNLITKQLGLRAGKFRTFILESVETVKAQGKTININ